MELSTTTPFSQPCNQNAVDASNIMFSLSAIGGYTCNKQKPVTSFRDI